MFALSPKNKYNSVLPLFCSLLPLTKYISNKYRGRGKERINTKHGVGGGEKLSESLTAWSTQVADSQETDLIMLLVTMLCPYSGWHRCWQRPPLHSNQETKCRGAPQSPVGRSLANHLPGSGGKQAETTALTYSTMPSGRQSSLSTLETKVHQGERGGEKLTNW